MDSTIFHEYAPYIVILAVFFIQNHIFVRPAELERKHREILKDVKRDYVELNAYKEFQNHVLREIAGIKEDISKGFDDVKEVLLRRRKDD